MLTCSQCSRKYDFDKTSGHTRTRCNSCVVNKRRPHIKAKAIEYMGGKCVNCGYAQCWRSMTFHHLDPTVKAFTISAKLSYAWDRLRAELDKCILVCANCHGEIHEGLLDLSLMAKHRLDKPGSLGWTSGGRTTRGPIVKKERKVPRCLDCQREITNGCVRCMRCENNRPGRQPPHSKIVWPEHAELLRLFSVNGGRGTGRLLGVTDAAIKKHLRKTVVSE
jgi:hypothetical protein